MYVSDAERLMAKITPKTPAEQIRFDIALELLDDVRRLDAQTKESHRRIRIALKASGTSLTEIYGVGPIIAAQIIGYTGDVRRFANRDAYASYNGTAPVEWSSGGRIVHRVSQRATASSTTPSTWLPSRRSVIPGPKGGSTSSARSPRARPRRRPSARSSARSPTPSTDSSSSIPKGVREDTRKRLVACVVGSTS
jgi:transposase